MCAVGSYSIFVRWPRDICLPGYSSYQRAPPFATPPSSAVAVALCAKIGAKSAGLEGTPLGSPRCLAAPQRSAFLRPPTDHGFLHCAQFDGLHACARLCALSPPPPLGPPSRYVGRRPPRSDICVQYPDLVSGARFGRPRGPRGGGGRADTVAVTRVVVGSVPRTAVSSFDWRAAHTPLSRHPPPQRVPHGWLSTGRVAVPGGGRGRARSSRAPPLPETAGRAVSTGPLSSPRATWINSHP